MNAKTARPNPYDRAALKAIQEFKTPSTNLIKRFFKTMNYPLEWTADVVMELPLFGKVMKKATGGIVSLLNDAASYSVRTKAIYRDFHKAGHDVSCAADIHLLSLEEVDKVVGLLALKYKSLALGIGGSAGSASALGPAAGAAAIAADITALITLNLRAIGEYATYYGFDIDNQGERLFAFKVLNGASDSSAAAKQLAMCELTGMARQVAQKSSWEALKKNVLIKVIHDIAKKLGIRLTKAKLAQIIPGLGGAIGAGYDIYFTASVCDTAFFLYRERFLAKKYGVDVISDVPVPDEANGL